MLLPDFLELDANGEVRVKGHRIRLIDVAARYREGHSAEGILFDYYPTLSLAEIHKTIGFYLEHLDEVDALVAENEKAMAELEASTPRKGPTLAELQRRMALRFPSRGKKAEAS